MTAEYLTWLQAVSKADAAFREVDTLLAVKELFVNSEIHALEQTALAPIKGGFVDIVATQSQPVISAGGSAASAFGDYIAGGGAQSAIGAATSGAYGTAYAPVVTEATSSGYGALGILSADVGVVGAAVAPLLGVALGAGIYASNPELVTKISQALLPFAYEDSLAYEANHISIYVDADGNTWIDGEIVGALNDLFIDEGIPTNMNPPGKWATSDLIPGIEFPYYVNPAVDGGGYVTGKGYFWNDGNSLHWVDIDPEPGSGTRSYTYDGRTVEYTDAVLLGAHISSAPTGSYSAGQVAWTAKYGTITVTEYPDGTSKWGGDVVDLSNLPTKDIVYDYDNGNTKSAYPISLPPYGTDGSIDPTQQPDPTEPEDIDTQVTPYDMPDLLPFPPVVPDYNPETNPETDPSSPPTTKPPVDIKDGTPPPSSGDSPPPNVPILPVPTGENVNGLIAVYHPTPDELYSFSRWLWVTYADASNLNLIWNNPFDGVIGCHELYCTPTDIGRRNIRCGFLDSGINSAIISRYTEINCGNIVVPEYYGNYLDYSPYTSVHIYLPFVGIVQVDADDIIGHAVNITYHIDEYNGSCIAMITVAKSTTVAGETVEYSNLVYQFEGNCAVEVPLSGGSQANIKIAAMTGIMQAVMSTVGGAFGGMMSGNPASAVGGGVMGLAQGLANAGTTLMHAKSSVQHSGQFGASYGAMGVKKPFIIIQNPIQVRVPNYNLEYGFPAHKFVRIGSCTGYLRCREVNVISARATNEEKARIEELLKSGVFVQ